MGWAGLFNVSFVCNILCGTTDYRTLRLIRRSERVAEINCLLSFAKIVKIYSKKLLDSTSLNIL